MTGTCSFGCTTRNRHTTDCTCGTIHDDDHAGHCRGCQPRPAEIGHWCRYHWDRTLDALTDIPELVAHIAAAPDGRLIARATTSGDDSRRATKVNQGSPSPAWDTTDELILWARAWAEAVADLNQHAGPFTYTRSGLPTRDLGGPIGYLRIHLETIAVADFAVDFAGEAIQHRRNLELATGSDRLVHRLKARCPSCNQLTLVREDGADRVDCRNKDCARVWSEAEYATLAHVAAS